MKTIHLALVCAAVSVPAIAQVSDLRLAPRQMAPIRDKVEHSDGTATSTNWSGYALKGTDFTSASGSWIVPAVTCTSGDQYSAFWVGLDGYNSSTVEQTGTESDCTGTEASYYAWVEFYPGPSFEILSVPVSPGDTISASVTYSGIRFTTTITDETTGKTSSTSTIVPGAKRSSAEWVAEAPCCDGGSNILPLADFGTGQFGYGFTGISGTNAATAMSNSGAIGNFPSADVEEINKTGTRTSPQTVSCSALLNTGTSFTCTWASQ